MITNTIKKIIHTSFFFFTLSHISTAMEIEPTKIPFHQLSQLPLDVWHKTGEITGILTPKDVLAFQSTCRAARNKGYHHETGVALMNGASTSNPCIFKLESYLTTNQRIADYTYLAPRIYHFISDISERIREAMEGDSSDTKKVLLMNLENPYKRKVLASEKAGVLSIELLLKNISLDELTGILPFFKTFFKNVKTIRFIRPESSSTPINIPTDLYVKELSESGVLDHLTDFEIEDASKINSEWVCCCLERSFDVCIHEKEIHEFKERSIRARRKTKLIRPINNEVAQ